ncbi:MAG TPA: alpha/beta fold hydrolase [Paracoccaceae bacterium]|nr:alpha/beta fold hydrolase [Paracoccaceae bacterium]
MALLSFDRYGETGGLPLVIAHGLFGSGRNWRAVAKALARERPVLAVDMRNHGASFHAASHAYADLAADLAEMIAAEGGRAQVLGHSMGGKAAMVLALTAPERVERLVVADIAPVGYDHSHAQSIEAMRAVDLGRVRSRGEAEAQMAPYVADAAQRGFLLQSLVLGQGGPRWMFNLDVLDGSMEALVGFPAIGGRFDGPVLFLSGARSDYVLPEYHQGIRALFPAAEFEVLEGAGHWLHADRPRAFIAAAERFLAR